MFVDPSKILRIWATHGDGSRSRELETTSVKWFYPFGRGKRGVGKNPLRIRVYPVTNGKTYSVIAMHLLKQAHSYK